MAPRDRNSDDPVISETPPERGLANVRDEAAERQEQTAEREMPCPNCGSPMPDLKGGKASICPVCGFKDSCCY